MKSISAIAILLVTIFALSSITVIQQIRFVNASPGSSTTLALSDAELMLTEFTKENGPGTLTGKVDVAGAGVQFDFTGLQPTVYTDVANNFPVNTLAGGAYKDYGYGFAGSYDFSGYKQYCLCVENVGTNPVTVALKMNTGWTVDWSGGLWKGADGFGASLARDTLWFSDWVTINPGDCKVVSLNFASATCYHAGDDPVVAWQHPDGTTGVQVQRLDEVSNIGFAIFGSDVGQIVVKGTQLYVDPPVVNKTPSDVGTTFDVYVTLENFANFAGFDINMTWNGSIITCTSVDHTTALDALWGAGNWSAPIEQSGAGFYRLVVVALATSASNLGASVLYKMTFHVDTNMNSPLSTQIHFESVSLSDNGVPVPNSICAVVTDGTYYMSGVPLVHDVAVTNVAANRTWIFQGKSCGFSINVTVLNKGNFSEDVTVTLYYNKTANKIVDTQNITLLVGESKTISFIWNSTGVICCRNYTMTGVATILPTDSNPADNTLSDGKVEVRLLGDLNDDGKVDIKDIALVAKAFGAVGPGFSHPGSPPSSNWNPDADINQDNKIDIKDIAAVAKNFGAVCPP